MKKFLSYKPISLDMGLLLVRIVFGLSMMTHGWSKLMSYSDKAAGFYDPFGIGGEASLALAIFAELICSLLLVLGLYTRVILIPLIITMVVAAFSKHLHDPYSKMEMAVLYLGVYITLFFTGSGKYSVTK